MRTYRVGICDRDMDFATALMDYAQADRGSVFSFIAFSGNRAVADYLSVQDLDFVLTDDITGCDISEKGISISDVRVILLSEVKDPEPYNSASSEKDFIYKYQKASLFLENLKALISMDKTSVRQPAAVIAVYSPIGRCGKTRLARALAYDDEVRGGLYVAMEDISDNVNALGSDILYQTKIHAAQLETTVRDHLVDEGGIKALYLSGTYMDSSDISYEDIEELIRVLMGMGSFTTVVFDIGSAAIRDMRILGIFDRIYMPVLRDEISVRKIEVHSRLLKETGQRQVLTKLIPVDVPDAEACSEVMVKKLWELKSGGG